MIMKSGIRMTRQRSAILEELKRTDQHPTADELYDLVRRRIPNISLGTVYRNLDKLSRLGLIKKIKHAGSQMRFGAAGEGHGHIRCVRCGRVDDLPGDPDQSHLDEEIVAASGYELIDMNVVYTGICPECGCGEGGQ
jgi:Fur family ferric uptake transcriptional regulator